MANKTVQLSSYTFKDRTGLTLLLIHPETGAIGNGSGSPLTPGANGQFTGVVSQPITGFWRVVVVDGSVGLIEGEWVRFPADVEGVYVVNNPVDMAANVYALPTKGTQVDRRVSTSRFQIYKSESYTLVRTVEDDSRALVNLSGKTLEFIVEAINRNDKVVLGNADITISGTGSATYSVVIPSTLSQFVGRVFTFWLWDVTNPSRRVKLDSGEIEVVYAGTTGSAM